MRNRIIGTSITWYVNQQPELHIQGRAVSLSNIDVPLTLGSIQTLNTKVSGALAYVIHMHMYKSLQEKDLKG